MAGKSTANPKTGSEIFNFIVDNNITLSSGTEWVQSRSLARAVKSGRVLLNKSVISVERVDIKPTLTNAAKKALGLEYNGNPDNFDASHLSADMFNSKGEFSGTLAQFKALDLNKGGLFFKTYISTEFGVFPTIDDLYFESSNIVNCMVENGEPYTNKKGVETATYILVQV